MSLFYSVCRSIWSISSFWWWNRKISSTCVRSVSYLCFSILSFVKPRNKLLISIYWHMFLKLKCNYFLYSKMSVHSISFLKSTWNFYMTSWFKLLHNKSSSVGSSSTLWNIRFKRWYSWITELSSPLSWIPDNSSSSSFLSFWGITTDCNLSYWFFFCDRFLFLKLKVNLLL